MNQNSLFLSLFLYFGLIVRGQGHFFLSITLQQNNFKDANQRISDNQATSV